MGQRTGTRISKEPAPGLGCPALFFRLRERGRSQSERRLQMCCVSVGEAARTWRTWKEENKGHRRGVSLEQPREGTRQRGREAMDVSKRTQGPGKSMP